ncbi:hypothetical protein [Luteimonas abyssi]|uniref:hypothetical protein n=1 Tax=Luteimonas abyssi TaxID=1247514 RepID=UPI000737CDD8|nr:hypothetical protein [Luteimonas abyssi]
MAAIVPLLLATGAAHAVDGATSYFPVHDVPRFLFDHLDVATFRSSLGPKRSLEQRTFAQISPPPTEVTDDAFEVREPDWLRRLTIVGRGDFNRDGIEDLVICLEDRALRGTYLASQRLLVTRYDAASLAVAVHYEPPTLDAGAGCLGAVPG